jgi:alpha-L-fucosidase
MLVDIASKGGNYLLNVGPTAQGVIPQPSVERLRAMGKWLEKNGESIYGTSGSPLGRFTWGRCTAKPGKLYLHVFNWPVDGRLQVPGLKSKVKKAYLLVDKKRAKLPVTREGNDTVVIGLRLTRSTPLLCWKSTTKSKLKKRNKILIKE